MIWLLWKLLTLPLRVVLGTIGLSLKTVRLLGPGRVLAFGAGVGVGLATAPTTGEEFRARFAERCGASWPTHGVRDLADEVRGELRNAPRTWHLPQPTVRVDGTRVTLTGSVPHAEARGELIRTAGSVLGVTAVDDQLTVSSV